MNIFNASDTCGQARTRLSVLFFKESGLRDRKREKKEEKKEKKGGGGA